MIISTMASLVIGLSAIYVGNMISRSTFDSKKASAKVIVTPTPTSSPMFKSTKYK